MNRVKVFDHSRRGTSHWAEIDYMTRGYHTWYISYNSKRNDTKHVVFNAERETKSRAARERARGSPTYGKQSVLYTDALLDKRIVEKHIF